MSRVRWWLFSTFGADTLFGNSLTPGCRPGVIHIWHLSVPSYYEYVCNPGRLGYLKINMSLINNHHSPRVIPDIIGRLSAALCGMKRNGAIFYTINVIIPIHVE
ncbi:MAG TPA: hypothetical protein PK719_01805 [Bacteroidales bacterium]|nr:hypothetical protein [Bacteroidales bacterium]